MLETATSPRAHHAPSTSASRAPKPARTPSTKTPAASTSQTMPPFLSTPRLCTPLEKAQSHAKSPSPNYFGFQVNNDGNAFHTDSKGRWSPPSSAVRSTAAASPSVIPVDQNSDFDAFRRQSEEGKAFDLGGLGGNGYFKMNAPPAGRPKQDKAVSKTSVSQPTARTVSDPKNVLPAPSRGAPNASLDPATAELARSPKRVLSPGSAAQLEPIRKGSPATFVNGEQERPQSQNQPRFKLPLDSPNDPHHFAKVQRAETLPASTPSEPEQMFVTPQHVVNLMDAKTEEILILDLRVSTQYGNSHVTGALNLCIPTTLLKRPTFNVRKLAETFRDEEQRNKFEDWRNSSYIIVYDTSSAQLKDAQICLNTIKKFQGEGYEGTLYIIRGGFLEFNKRFSAYVDAGLTSTASAGQQSGGGTDGPKVAPVIGGCPMPGTDKPANPFFGNIRQNMDLIGGVGQIALKHPEDDQQKAKEYPSWLRRAADDQDQGKKVSGKFEAIEWREKKRMEDALSGQVSYGPGAAAKPLELSEKQSVQIAGIEKGNKNRYNNIWPFEHSRVKLQGVPKTACDYFNANFIQASWSNKRYISTQAPIPATFNDFWNVVWQQDVRVIVMLTAEKEGAQVKAHNYWDQKHYGPLYLDCLSEKRASLEPARIHKHKRQQKRPGVLKRASTKSTNPHVPLAPLDAKEDVINKNGSEQPYVIVRKFMLRDERHPFEPVREITQLQYSSWPDFGAPAHPQHLLGLVEQTDAVVRATNKTHGSRDPEPPCERPVMVHCSAGCGRTGTFCTVDSVIDMLKRQRISQKEDRKQGTPMDIDEKTPARSPAGRQHSKTDSKIDGNDGGGFFGSASTHEEEAQGQEDEWAQSGEVDLVEKTVEDFRNQRLSMVQSLRQYVLCYESVMEWLVEQSPLDEDGRRES